MDIGSQQSQVTSDDQELAKVLAGISSEPEEAPFLETGAPATPPPLPSLGVDDTDTPEPTPSAEPTQTQEVAPVLPIVSTPAPDVIAAPVSNDLISIKSSALNELRPLVDKLSLTPEEMYDAYLLLIRSTDDKSLIAPAYHAAQSIADEARKAKALLEIVKEIDYLNSAV